MFDIRHNCITGMVLRLGLAAMSRSSISLPIPATDAEMANSGNELPGWLWQGFIA
jgi:hypothetical protein